VDKVRSVFQVAFPWITGVLRGKHKGFARRFYYLWRQKKNAQINSGL